MHQYETDGATIYRQSFAMIRAEADLVRFDADEEQVAVRMIHAAGMVGLEAHIRPYLNGRDLTQRSRGALVIDLFGLTEEELRRRFPAVWQHLS